MIASPAMCGNSCPTQMEQAQIKPMDITLTEKAICVSMGYMGSTQMTPFSQAQLTPMAMTTNVPENYSLSFELRPTGIVSHWASIFHYSGDFSDTGPRGRMPGTFFRSY